MTENVYEFSENNSGGSWWLGETQYKALFADGFYYERDEERVGGITDPEQPFLGRVGDTVPYGWRKGLRVKAASMQEAVERWEAATGEDFFAEGCNCCGCPFTAYGVGEDGDRSYSEYVSGDSVSRETIRPW